MKRSLVCVLVVLLAFVGQALAGPATDVVKARHTALAELLRDAADNQKKIHALQDALLDYDGLAKASLGSEWAARTAAEKAELTSLLKQLVRAAHERSLKKTLGFNIEYVAETKAASVVSVKTRAVSRTNAREEPIEIVYKLAQKDGAWRVQDIVTEGVSLVSSYRSQLTKIIKKDGVPTLIQKLKDKIAKGDI